MPPMEHEPHLTMFCAATGHVTESHRYGWVWKTSKSSYPVVHEAGYCTSRLHLRLADHVRVMETSSGRTQTRGGLG